LADKRVDITSFLFIPINCFHHCIISDITFLLITI